MGQKLGLGGDALRADPTYLLYIYSRCSRHLVSVDFDPSFADATSSDRAYPESTSLAQRGLVSWRTRWSCDLEVWAWAVGRLAPSTFPPVGAGGLAHLGSRRLPRMRSLADLVTAAVHKEGVVQGVQTRALVRDSTYIERGLAPPLRSVTRARHSVAVHVRMSVDARAASRQQPRQRSGSLRGQTERLSVLARAHQGGIYRNPFLHTSQGTRFFPPQGTRFFSSQGTRFSVLPRNPIFKPPVWIQQIQRLASVSPSARAL